MEKTLIRQNAQWNGKMFDHLCPRDIMDNLLKKKTMRHVQILTGVRRCGKSTVFKLLINDLLQSGASGKSILVLNLDDPQFIPFWDDSSKLFGVIENAERLTGEKVKYLFFILTPPFLSIRELAASNQVYHSRNGNICQAVLRKFFLNFRCLSRTSGIPAHSSHKYRG